jgi:hypothetical protein
MPDLTERIEDAASEPANMVVDGNVTTQRSIDELIKADEYLKANEAANSPKKGLVFGRMKPPGSA